MLKNVIIFWGHGPRLFAKSYGFGEEAPEKKDPSIVSGFLSAFSSFARELDDGELRSINMHKHMVLMSLAPCKDRKICFAIFLDQDDDEIQGKLILETLMTAFIAMFPEIDPNIVKDLNTYYSFADVVDDLFMIKNVYEVVESSSRILTLADIQRQYKEMFDLSIGRSEVWRSLDFLVKKEVIVEVKRDYQICYRKKGELLKGLKGFKK